MKSQYDPNTIAYKLRLIAQWQREGFDITLKGLEDFDTRDFTLYFTGNNVFIPRRMIGLFNPNNRMIIVTSN